MSSDLNKVELIGRLVADPEARSLTNGTTMCTARVAVNVSQKDSTTGEWGEKGHFFNVTLWGKQAEVVLRYAAKGSRLAFSGRLQQRTWKAEDGSNREQVGVVASSIQFLDSRPVTDDPPAAVKGEPTTTGTLATDDVPF
jgi:single-strand DNA-binding protein